MSRFSAQLYVVLFSMTALVAPAAIAEDVPDALSVEWQGKKPCESFFEDAQIRVSRCTLPPGTAHVCHSHPSYVYYLLGGGKAEVQNEKGTRKVDLAAGAFVQSPPVPWHDLANIGETPLQFLIIEKKYEPAPHVSQTVCPNRTSQQ